MDQSKYNAFYSMNLKKISLELYATLNMMDFSNSSEYIKNILKVDITEILRKLKNPLNNETLSDEDINDIIYFNDGMFKNGNHFIINELTKKLLNTKFGKEYKYYLRIVFPNIVHEDKRSLINMTPHTARTITGKSKNEIFLNYYLANSLEILIGMGIVLDRAKYKGNIKIDRNDNLVSIISGTSYSNFLIKNGKPLMTSNNWSDELIGMFIKYSPIFDKSMYKKYIQHSDSFLEMEIDLDDYFFKGNVMQNNINNLSIEEILSSIKSTISSKRNELGNLKSKVTILEDELTELRTHLDNISKAADSIEIVKKYLE